MKDEAADLRAELERVREERDRLEREVTLWRARCLELQVQAGEGRLRPERKGGSTGVAIAVQAIAAGPPVSAGNCSRPFEATALAGR